MARRTAAPNRLERGPTAAEPSRPPAHFFASSCRLIRAGTPMESDRVVPACCSRGSDSRLPSPPDGCDLRRDTDNASVHSPHAGNSGAHHTFRELPRNASFWPSGRYRRFTEPVRSFAAQGVTISTEARGNRSRSEHLCHSTLEERRMRRTMMPVGWNAVIASGPARPLLPRPTICTSERSQ